MYHTNLTSGRNTRLNKDRKASLNSKSQIQTTNLVDIKTK